MQSRDLEVAVAHWLRDFDVRAGQYDATLHTIIETLEKYADKTESKRPKGVFGADIRKRVRLPTERILPRRRDSMEHAWKQGLITDEEYQSALPLDVEAL